MDSITKIYPGRRKVHRIYEVNPSSTVWSACGFVGFRVLC